MTKITLNKAGEYIVISADDTTLFDRFVNFCSWLVKRSDEIDSRYSEIEKKYGDSDEIENIINKTTEMSEVNVRFSHEATAQVDSIFGADTIKKYFREVFDEIPDFLPSADCFLDFVEDITPKIEGVFNRKIEERNQKRKKAMEKYKPQDYKKKN